METKAFTTVPRKRRKKTNLDLEKPTVVSCDQGPPETIENPVIVNDICLEVGAVSTNSNTDLVLAPISCNNSRDVATLGCASVFLTEEIDAGVGSQFSSVHVEMKTQLTIIGFFNLFYLIQEEDDDIGVTPTTSTTSARIFQPKRQLSAFEQMFLSSDGEEYSNSPPGNSKVKVRL